MSKNSINSLSEAIEKLESVSQSKTQQLKEHFENDYEQILKALEDVKPYLTDLKNKVDQEARTAKTQVEEKVKESPWLTIGIIGLLAFFMGLFLGRQKK